MNVKVVFLVITLVGIGAGYYFVLADVERLATVGYGDVTTSSDEISLSEAGAQSFTATEEVGFEAEPETMSVPDYRFGQGGWYTLEELRSWERAPGPLRVGLQVGHLDNDKVPEELSGLTRNGAGATAAGYNERDTVEVITRLTAELLEAEGIVVDILPATVPPKYEADAFVSIHADGNNNTNVRGFKHAGPRRDYSGRSDALVSALYESYKEATGLPTDPSISRRMTAYYAFNWARYEHAVHPFTPSAIVETGFLTNPTDRAFLLGQPEQVAEGIAGGILAFLAEDTAPSPPPLLLSAPTFPLVGTIECAEVRAERRNRPARPCEAALTDKDDNQFLLISNPPIATSSLPFEARVTGEYMPVQMLDNYFWFHFEVLGLVGVSEIERL